MRKFIIIADDITGACDAGAYLCEYEDNIKVLIDSSDIPKGDNQSQERALVYNTHTRVISPENAYDIVRKLGVHLRGIQDKTIFKKIDTGYRGNVALEINSLMDSLDIKECFIINSIPVINTITVGGYQIVMGKLLEQSDFSKDPISKVEGSFVPEILNRNSKRRVSLIGLKCIREGRLNLEIRKKAAKDCKIFVFDAASEDDIKKIVDTLYETHKDALWAGSLGLVNYLSEVFFNNRKRNNFLTGADEAGKRVIGFTTSTQAATEKQIEKAEMEGTIKVINVDIEKILNKKSPHSEIDKIIKTSLEEIEKGNHFIKLTTNGDCFIKRIDKVILEFLNIIAKQVCNDAQIDKIVLIGGDTSYSVLRGLDVTMIELWGRIEPAIACGMILDGKLKNKEISIKGGSAGSEDGLVNMNKFYVERGYKA